MVSSPVKFAINLWNEVNGKPEIVGRLEGSSFRYRRRLSVEIELSLRRPVSFEDVKQSVSASFAPPLREIVTELLEAGLNPGVEKVQGVETLGQGVHSSNFLLLVEDEPLAHGRNETGGPQSRGDSLRPLTGDAGVPPALCQKSSEAPT